MRKSELSIEVDEHIKEDTNYEILSKLRPAFIREGTVTAGNSSGINDGAASVIVASEKAVQENGLQPIARIVSWGIAGVDPTIMGIGPVPAIKQALQRANLTLGVIALGHPVGASGTRITLSSAYELKRRGGKYTAASLCIGGGQGIALIIESV